MAQIPQPSRYGLPALDYTPVVNNLSFLGQQIGQSIAQKQMMKDAESVMPAMQQAYSSAFEKMKGNDVAGAYQDIMNAQFTFGSLGNPLVDLMNQRAAETAATAAKGVYQEQLYRMQYGPRETTTTTPGLPVMSGADVVRQRAMGGTPQVKTGQPPVDAQNAVVNAVPLPGDPDLNQPVDEVAIPELTPTQQATRATAQAYKDMAPEEKIAYDQTVVAIDPPKTGYEKKPVPGLEEFYGTNEIFIPSVGTKIKQSYTISGKSTEPGTAETLRQEEVEVGREEYNEANKIIKVAADAVSYISKNRPVGAKKTFKDIIKEGGGFQYFDTAPNQGNVEDPERFPEVLISTKTGEEFPMTLEQSQKIAVMRGLTSLVNSRGLRFGAGAEPKVAIPEAQTAGSREEQLRQAQEILGLTAPTPAPTPQGAPAPTPVPFGEQYATPEERERAMTERIRGGIGAGLRAVGRGGEAILRGARAIR